jgi:CheY-like chemotaxis protein
MPNLDKLPLGSSEFLIEFIHDLRNPVSSIRAGARLLMRAKTDPDVVEQLANGIKEQAEKLSQIIDKVSAQRLGSHVSSTTTAGEPSIKSHTATRTLHILVADDDVESAATLAMYLRMEGHIVTVAHDGSEALQLADAHHPEVLVLDISMPTKNGYEVARELRARDWCGGSKVVAVSGYGRIEDEERALASGFDAHLTKPIDIDRLQRILLS